MKRGTILLVEDDPQLAPALARLLEDWGYAVATSSGGTEGAGRFRSDPTDLVMTDIVMAQGDGFHLIERIREFDPEVPIVVLTGYPSVDHCAHAFRAGASHFLSKPFSEDELERILREASARAPSAELRARLFDRGRLDVSFEIEPNESSIPLAVAMVTGLAKSAGWGRKHWAIRRALEEAVRNSVRHGSGVAGGAIRIAASFAGLVGEVSVADGGPGFDPDRIGPSRGLDLLRTFSDDIAWEDGGRLVRLRYLRPETRIP